MKIGDIVRLLTPEESPETRYTKDHIAYGAEYGIVTSLSSSFRNMVVVTWYLKDGSVLTNQNAIIYIDPYVSGTTEIVLRAYNQKKVDENLDKLMKKYEKI